MATFTVPPNIQSLTLFHLIGGAGFLVVDNYSLTMVPAPPSFNRGMVSLDFDDGWQSTFTNAIPILDAAGFKSTQYIITGYMQNAPGYVTKNQVLQMYNTGHDIEAHTQTHPDLTTLTQAQMTTEISGSRQDLINIGITPIALAFPYGTYNSAVLQTVKNAGFTASRTALVQDGGYNYKNQDPYLLKTQDVESATTLADIRSWIDSASVNKTWLILVLHSVAGDGTQYDTSPAKLQSIVNYLKTSNVDVVTVKQGANQLVP
jgi:peptidoglycan/xylan/chitin deacetylase (PgdA/CDA1 family)